MLGKLLFLGFALIVVQGKLGALGASFEPLSSSSDALISHPKQTRSVDSNQNVQVQLCGLRLLEAVRIICRPRGGYIVQRRSDPSLSLAPLYEELDIPIPVSGNSLDGTDGNPQYPNDGYVDNGMMDFPDSDLNPWGGITPRLFGLKLFSEGRAHTRVRRSNIIDECCKRPCPRHEMMKYCVRPN